MAGKQIANLDVGVASRTNVIAQQDASATSDANKITLADALGLIQVGDIPDLSSTYQEVSEKNSANGYAGLNASAKLPTSTIDQDSATLNQALLWNGSQWSPGSVAVNIDTTGQSEGQVLMSDGTDFLPADLPSILSNPIINPTFAIVQRQPNPATLTTYTDGSYSADRWVLLTQDANGQFGRITGDTQRYAGQLKKTASGTTRIGTIQWIEGINCYHLRGQTVTLQMRVRCSESSKTIRCGIVESTKTEDTITRNAIDDWTTTPVTLIADYSFSGTPGSVTSDTNWQTLTYTTTLGSSFNNLGVLIWSETGLAQDATLDIEAVKLSISEYPTLFVPRSIADELTLCQRYFEKLNRFFGMGQAFSTTQAVFFIRLGVRKRVTPTITINNATSGFLASAVGSSLSITSMSASTSRPDIVDIRPVVASGLVSGNVTYMFANLDTLTIDLNSDL